MEKKKKHVYNVRVHTPVYILEKNDIWIEAHTDTEENIFPVIYTQTSIHIYIYHVVTTRPVRPSAPTRSMVLIMRPSSHGSSVTPSENICRPDIPLLEGHSSWRSGVV